MQYTQGTEAPESYHLWAGFFCLASAVRRNAWIDMRRFLVYPNQYIVFVGEPGRTTKTTAIRMGRDVLKKVEMINFGPDSCTREDLIKQLATLSRKGATQAAMAIVSGEMSSLIDPSHIHMIQFLTDIYDCEYDPKGWKYSTKQKGKFSIIHPVINILAGTTPSWIADGLPVAAAEHGFTSRTIFIYEADPRGAVPFPSDPDPVLTSALANDLDHISRLEGEFAWEVGARDTYIKIYNHVFNNRPIDHRVEGFHNRKRIHILKLAMLLSLSEDDSLTVRSRDLEAALDILDEIEAGIPKVFASLGKYELASDMERMLKRIQREGKIALSTIYNDFSSVGDMETLGKIVNHLRERKKIRVERDSEGERYLYPISPS